MALDYKFIVYDIVIDIHRLFLILLLLFVVLLFYLLLNFIFFLSEIGDFWNAYNFIHFHSYLLAYLISLRNSFHYCFLLVVSFLNQTKNTWSGFHVKEFILLTRCFKI